MGLREVINQKPWIGWTVAVFFAVAAAFLGLRLLWTSSPQDRLSETVTIKCMETGEEWQMNRGLLELELARQSALGPLDPSKGVINPKTGRPTGFPFDKSDWTSMIERINQDRAALDAERAKQPQPAPPAPGAPARSVPAGTGSGTP